MTSQMAVNIVDEWHERINDIRDICNTTIIYDSMTRDEVIDLLYSKLGKIDELATYPDEHCAVEASQVANA